MLVRAKLTIRVAAAIVALGGLVLIGALFVVVRTIPLPEDLEHPRAGTTTLTDCHGHKIAVIASAQARTQEPAPLRAMGKLPAITVALEDRRFYRHGGFDLRALAAAFLTNVRAGRIICG